MKEPILYKIIRPIIKMLCTTIFKPKIIGKENIPNDGRLILAGNHTNIFDCILLLSSTNRCIHFLAKDSLIKGWKKPIFKDLGIIPVNRTIHDKNALNDAKKILLNEGLIGIFPESTINRTDNIIMPFKIGAVKMSHDTNSQIVPFTITGKYIPFKNDLTIKFEKPFIVEDENLEYENKKLMKIISRELKRRSK